MKYLIFILTLVISTNHTFCRIFNITDLTGSSDSSNIDYINLSLIPEVDTVMYDRITMGDTLVSGIQSLPPPGYQSAWPTLVSTGIKEFRFSYIYFRREDIDGGNYLYEKRLRVRPENNDIYFYCRPNNAPSHADSAGTLLSTDIMLINNTYGVGGYNAKSLIGNNGIVHRICQGYIGMRDTLYVVDTIAGAGGNNYILPLDNSAGGSRTYPDYIINSTKDTIFTAYTINGINGIYVKPIIINGRNDYTVGPKQTVINNNARTDIRDVSMDRDESSGYCLFACFSNYGLIECFLTNSSFDSLYNLELENPAALIPLNARNVKVESLGNDKFAVVYWKGNNGQDGIVMRLLDVSGGTITIENTITLESGIGLVPSMDLKNNRLAIVWIKNRSATEDYRCQIKGRIYSINNGSLDNLLYSGPISYDSTFTKNYTTPPANYCSAVALDSDGNLVNAFVKEDYRIHVNAWGFLNFYQPTSYSILNVDSLDDSNWPTLNQDSIIFSGFTVTDTGTGGSVSIDFRSSNNGSISSSFKTVTVDSTVGPTVGKYFQFRVNMQTDATNKKRPVASQISFNYNVRPKNINIDSFAINNSSYSSLNTGDTIDIYSRSDTLKIYSSAMDFDNSSYILFSYNGYESSVILNTNASRVQDYTYSKQTLFDPVDHIDSVYKLNFTAIDTNSWCGDTDHVYINLVNDTPSIAVSDTMFLFDTSLGSSNPNNNDTVYVMKRHYNIFRFRTSDMNDSLDIDGNIYINNNSIDNYSDSYVLTDTLYSYEITNDTAIYAFSARDPGGLSDSFYCTVIAYNNKPSDSLWGILYNLEGQIEQQQNINENDTIFIVDSSFLEIRTFAKDSNETDVDHYTLFNSVVIDSLLDTLDYIDTIYADSVDLIDTVQIVVADSFSSDTSTFFVRVNHPPIINSVTFQNYNDTEYNDSSYISVTDDFLDSVIINVLDQDVFLDDTLIYELYVDDTLITSKTSVFQAETLIYTPSSYDYRGKIKVTDKTLMNDSLTLFFMYPSFTFDTTSFTEDSLYFSDSISLYVTRTNEKMDSVNAESRKVKLVNTGTDTLVIDSLYLKSNPQEQGWVKMSIQADGSSTPSSYSTYLDSAFKILPQDTFFLWIRDSAAVPFGDSLGYLTTYSKADTVYYDTLVIRTNDLSNNSVTIPLKIECNELPYVFNDSLIFKGEVRPFAKTLAVEYDPKNPFYSRLAIVFNEFVDRNTVTDTSLLIYSRPDSTCFADSFATDTVIQIPGIRSWNSRTNAQRDTLFFAPSYTSNNYTSPAFGFMPRDSFFIAIDTVAVMLKNYITDLAGNTFDTDGDYVPDQISGAYKIISTQIDNSSLTITDLYPDSSSQNVSSESDFIITFSTPINQTYFDTSLTNNRSVRAVSAFSEDSIINFSSISIDSNKIILRPKSNFYGGDTITVTLSASIRDSFANTLDGNRNGIGEFFYTHDTDFTVSDTFMNSNDNYTYTFYIEKEKFYFYPCPYNPSKNTRHRDLGGIVFKNIHNLYSDQKEHTLNLRIYNVTGDLVFSSSKRGQDIEFFSQTSSSEPRYLWDTKNTKGNKVGSGIYIFVFTDEKEKKVLKKGKLLIVR